MQKLKRKHPILRSAALAGAGLGWSAYGVVNYGWSWLGHAVGVPDIDDSLGTSIFLTVFFAVMVVVWAILLRGSVRLADTYDYDSAAAHELTRLGYNRDAPYNKLESNG